MYLNLSTTYPNGGWMYIKINNDGCMQLSGSDNKVNIYKNISMSGNLNAAGRILIDGPHLNVQPKSSTSSETWVFDQSFSTEVGSDSHGINVYGRQGGNSHLNFYNGRSGSVCNVLIDGNLDVNVSNARTSIKAYNTMDGYTSYVELEAKWNSQGYVNFEPNRPGALYVFTTVKDDLYMYCGNNLVHFYKTTTNASDDRLKENEELIENACETLSKLRPQLDDKKPDMENDDPTTRYKASGLIAQEIYYDAPELKHVVHRGIPELDEDGNSIPLPEIPTSIDPQQDPDYSPWGKEPASVNYIGLLAYLVKANTELHERVKLLESK